MALTNFGLLTDEELTVWSRDFWSKARNAQFLTQFMGSSHMSMIHRVTELTKTKKGARAVITLINDLEGDGVAGDRTLEGNEEGLTSEEVVIPIDQLRHANRHEGKMAEQASVVTFRKESRDKLAYWMADRLDQMAFLTMSGVSFSMKNNGAVRVGSDLVNLEYANALVPTANRHYRWDATTGLEAGDTTAVDPADTITWKMLVQIKAQAEEDYMKPVRMENGVAFYHVFVTPTTMAHLKQDADFLANLRGAAPRTNANPLFKGADSYYVDGMAIHAYRHVYNTRGATSGVDKWGAGADVDGSRVLVCGAQALAYADIGNPEWVEKGFDYDNQQGISIGKICGMIKPQFKSVTTGTLEDFGVMCVDVAQ